MTKEIQLIVVDNEPRVDSRLMADHLGIEHESFMRMIRKYEGDISEFGLLRFKIGPSASGQTQKWAFLNEDQSIFALTLSRNTNQVVALKKKLTKEFGRQRKILANLASQQQNAEWLEMRNAGKQKRRVETDTIQRFVTYAVSQGSQNAERYYANISKMQNKALFFVEQKFKNLRDILNLQQLSIVICADEIVTKAIDDGMSKDLHYKDIYQLAKTRIENFAEIHGKTLIPAPMKQLTSESAN